MEYEKLITFIIEAIGSRKPYLHTYLMKMIKPYMSYTNVY